MMPALDLHVILCAVFVRPSTMTSTELVNIDDVMRDIHHPTLSKFQQYAEMCNVIVFHLCAKLPVEYFITYTDCSYFKLPVCTK